MSTTISNIDIKAEFKLIFELREIIVKEFASSIKSVQKNSDRLELGTSLLLLKSIFNHLISLECLLERCAIESSGSVATSLWEKSMMLQFLLYDTKTRIKVYAEHNTFKKLPWTIRDMVIDVVKRETLSKNRNAQDSIDLQYLQYSYLCAIKHGNPYTLSYLNRLTAKEDFFEPKPHINIEDKDILGWIYLNSITSLFDALREFSKVFTTKEQHDKLIELDNEITFKYIRNIELKIPQIIMTSPKDFRKEFWDYLVDLNAKTKY
jgi:hypothetical protein